MIDQVDKQILELLQEDARMPNKEIAYRVGLVPSATSERLKRLRERGFIKSFETRLDPAKVGCKLLAFVFVRTNELGGGWSTGGELAQIPEIQEVYNIAGEDCYLIKIRANDTGALTEIIRDKVGAIKSIVSTRTTIVMETYKETCRVPIDIKRSSGGK
jgi:Lrp/AsnC family leucine-responsive transcriptional regulator